LSRPVRFSVQNYVDVNCHHRDLGLGSRTIQWIAAIDLIFHDLSKSKLRFSTNVLLESTTTTIMRLHLCFLSIWIVDGVFGRHGAPSTPSEPVKQHRVVRPFPIQNGMLNQWGYVGGWALDTPKEPEEKAETVKQVKRGKLVLASCLSGVSSCADKSLLDDNTVLSLSFNHFLLFRPSVKTIKKSKKEEEPVRKPGWFRSTPEHHAKFLDIADAFDGLE
jgi:hypothetical protein